jgi:hypothetical protein
LYLRHPRVSIFAAGKPTLTRTFPGPFCGAESSVTHREVLPRGVARSLLSGRADRSSDAVPQSQDPQRPSETLDVDAGDACPHDRVPVTVVFPLDDLAAEDPVGRGQMTLHRADESPGKISQVAVDVLDEPQSPAAQRQNEIDLGIGAGAGDARVRRVKALADRLGLDPRRVARGEDVAPCTGHSGAGGDFGRAVQPQARSHSGSELERAAYSPGAATHAEAGGRVVVTTCLDRVVSVTTAGVAAPF